MIAINEKGIKVQDVTVPWEILNEHGIFYNQATEHYAYAHPSYLERVVWEAWRNHIVGGRY